MGALQSLVSASSDVDDPAVKGGIDDLLTLNSPLPLLRDQSEIAANESALLIPLTSGIHVRSRGSFSQQNNETPFIDAVPSPTAPRIHSVIMHELRAHTVRTAILAILAVVPIVLAVIRLTDRCDMTKHLMPLLVTTASVLNRHNVSYWIDYGTLLGAERDGQIIPHDFDVDFGIRLEDCNALYKLRGEFADVGMRLYGRSEWISAKASFLLLYSGYLNKACARLYDVRSGFCVDIDWHTKLDSRRLSKSTPQIAGKLLPTATEYGTVYLPTAYNPETDGDLWCNEEGFSANGGTDAGGCRRHDDLFPLKTVQMYQTNVAAPRHSERLLNEMYGADWRTPRTKGYKFVCQFFPSANMTIAIVIALYALLPIMAIAAYKTNPRLAQSIYNKLHSGCATTQ